MNKDFAIYFHELFIKPRTSYALWTYGKVKIQNKHLGAHFQIFLEKARCKWDKLTQSLLFLILLFQMKVLESHRMKLFLDKSHKYPCHLRSNSYEIHNSHALPSFAKTCLFTDIPCNLQTSKNTKIEELLKPTTP